MPDDICPGWHIDGDAVMLQHRDQGLAQLRIVIVGVRVDEIQHLAAAAPRRPGQTPAGGHTHEAARSERGSLRPLGNPQRLFQQPARPAIGEVPNSAIGRRQLPTARANRSATSTQSLSRQAVRLDIGPLASDHQLAECRRWPGIPAGTCDN